MESELIYVHNITKKDPRKILEEINLGGIEKVIVKPSLVDFSPRNLKDVARYLRGLGLAISSCTRDGIQISQRQSDIGHINYTHEPSALGSSWVTGDFYETKKPNVLIVNNELVFEEALVNQVVSVISDVGSEEKNRLRSRLEQYQESNNPNKYVGTKLHTYL